MIKPNYSFYQVSSVDIVTYRCESFDYHFANCTETCPEQCDSPWTSDINQGIADSLTGLECGKQYQIAGVNDLKP